MSLVQQVTTNLNNVLEILETVLPDNGWTVYRGPTTGDTISTELWFSKNGKHYIIHTSLLQSSVSHYYFARSYGEGSIPNFRREFTRTESETHGIHVLAVIACNGFSGSNKLLQDGRTSDTTFTGMFDPNASMPITIAFFNNSITVILKPSATNYCVLHVGDLVKAGTYGGNGTMMTNFISPQVLSTEVVGLQWPEQESPADWGWEVTAYPVAYLGRYCKTLLGAPAVELAEPGHALISSPAGYLKTTASRGGLVAPGNTLSTNTSSTLATVDQVNIAECITDDTDWCAEHSGGDQQYFYGIKDSLAVSMSDIVQGAFKNGSWQDNANSKNTQRAVKDSSFWQTAYLTQHHEGRYRSAPTPMFGAVRFEYAGADNRKMLIPVSWFRMGDNSGTAPDNSKHSYLLGYCEQVRSVSGSGLLPETTIEYGAERWFVIPDTVYQEISTPPNNATGVPTIGELRPWIAVRYN